MGNITDFDEVIDEREESDNDTTYVEEYKVIRIYYEKHTIRIVKRG